MRILIVDDHTLFREALILLLKESDPAITVIEASSAEEALSALEYYSDLDLILLDYILPGIDGLSALPLLRKANPTVPVMVLSGTEDHSAARNTLAEGAVGFIHKTAESQEISNAVRLVLQGEVYAPLAMLNSTEPDQKSMSFQSPGDEVTRLTKRQLEVLRLISEGLPNKTIA